MRQRLRPLVAALCLAALASLVASCTASTEIVALGDPAPTVDEVVAEVVEELSSEAVYTTIEDSIVFVQSPDNQSSGSGIVIEGGWILTNAHVVDRNPSVRIGRSDGEDLGLHPVHAVDWVFDLAVVGPIDDSSLIPMQRGVSGDLGLGGRVLLIGFPDEDSISPTPTLTEGIVSRRRFVSLGDYPFLQVDATIAPGQSGGALVNGRGELVGISGLEFGQGEFGLVFASDAMWPRLQDLIAEPNSQLPTGPGTMAITDEVGPLRNFGFTVEVDESGELEIRVSGGADVWVDVRTLGGFTVNQSEFAEDPFRGLATELVDLFTDDRSDGNETVNATIDPGVYQVLIGSYAEAPTTVSIESNSLLRQYPDVEELQTLPLGEVVEGFFDWSRDTDLWELPLEAGDQVSIQADGLADTVLAVRLDDTLVGSSDDDGLGLFGTGSRLEFVADQAGTYILEVGSFDNDRWGYLLEATLE